MSELAKNLGVTIHDFLRYGYAGFAVIVAVVLCAPNKLGSAIDELGVALTALAAFFAGAGVYVASRYTAVLGINRLAELVYSWFGTTETRLMYFGRVFNLGFFQTEDAWAVLREYSDVGGNYLWSREIQRQFYRTHSENHMLYATALVCLSAAVYLGFASTLTSCLIAIGVTAVFSVVAGMADILVSRRECERLRIVGDQRIRVVLIETGIIELDTPAPSASGTAPAPTLRGESESSTSIVP